MNAAQLDDLLCDFGLDHWKYISQGNGPSQLVVIRPRLTRRSGGILVQQTTTFLRGSAGSTGSDSGSDSDSGWGMMVGSGSGSGAGTMKASGSGGPNGSDPGVESGVFRYSMSP